jgi:hypothetical protein
MTALEILISLRRAGAIVTVAGDKLRFEAPPGVLTDELKHRLATQKAEIIRLLHAETWPSGRTMPKCSHCSKFRPIGQGGCSEPGDSTVSMVRLIECPDFVTRTVH